MLDRMLTIEQTERTGDPTQETLFSGRMIEPLELPLSATYYPLGFPAEVRTNSREVLEEFAALWGMFRKQRETEPIRCDVQLIEDAAETCPPAPEYRLMLPLVTSIADANNYCIADLDRAQAKIAVSRAALRCRSYVRHFLFGVPACCIATNHATPVHAGCVSLNCRGVLLCGDSGAGKSTLAYACARAGFTYIGDDGAYILDGGARRVVTGNCQQVRFRPAARELFPELSACAIAPRAVGKPSIELPTAPMEHLTCAQTARVDFIVFLNRSAAGSPELVPFSKEWARLSMRRVLYGTKESLARQYEAIERLLSAEVLEMRYTSLDWAVDRLRSLTAGL